MKTKIIQFKNNLLELKIVLVIVALVCFGFTANASCTASYSAVVDPANNGNVTFTNTSTTGTGMNYYWQFGDGTSDYTLSPTHTFGSTGTFTVCLTMYDSVGITDSILGCYNQYCTTINVINSATPCTASFNSLADTAGGMFFTSTSSGSPTTYAWDFGDGATSNASNPFHTYSTNGWYYVCLTITNPSISCSSSICDSVYSGPSLACNAMFSSVDSSGTTYFINYSTGSGIVSSWNFGDGTSGTSTGGIVHTYASAGTYTVCLTVSSFLGCFDTYCDSTVVVGGTTSTCHAYFSANDSTTFTQFYDYSTGAGTMSYSWDFGDGSYSTTAGNQTHTYAPGTYTACLTVSDSSGSCTNTYCNTINIGPPSGCYSYFYIIQDSSNLYNYFIYNASSSTGSTTYFWDFGDGTSSTLAYPTHTYASTTPVMICLTIADAFLGCTSTYCDSITPGLGMLSTFTINVLPTGIHEIENVISTLENYPNPFNSSTTISYTISNDANVSLNIIDLLGNNVANLENASKAKGSYSTEWHAENIAEGMYLMQLKVNNTISTKKIIITR